MGRKSSDELVEESLSAHACSAGRSRLSWLHLLGAAAGVLLAIEIVRPFASWAPQLRETVDTVMTLLALTAAGLMAAQFAHTRRLRRLLVLAAMLMLALNALLGSLPAALKLHYGLGFAAASPLANLFIAAALAAAAFTPPDRLIAGGARRSVLIAAIASAVAVAIAEVAGMLLHRHLLGGPNYLGRGIFRALNHPFGFAILIASALLLVYAVIDLARRARIEHEENLSLLAGAALMLLAAQLWYLAAPRLSPSFVTFEQIFLLAAIGFVLTAAVRKDIEIRRTLTRAAALAERRRVAQDLHDGLAQDLAFIAAHGPRMAQELGDDHPLTVAAKRALALSRQTITGLSDMSETPPGEALEAVAHELQQRFGIEIAVYAQPDAALPPDATDHVARIAREAIANAARHGHAHNIVISLTQTDNGAALRVCDDGRGLTRGEGERAPQGFGLRNLQERAAALGGHMSVRERRAGGTELEVVLP